MGNLLTVLGILITIGVAIFGALYTTNQKTTAIWVLFVTSVILLLGIFVFWQQQISKEENPKSARNEEPLRLAPGSGRPDSMKFEQPRFTEKTEAITFSLGGGGAHITYKLSELEKKPNEPFNFGGFSPVLVHVENGKIYADVKVYGGTGLPPIEIKHNEFVIRNPAWDRNSNEFAIEIVNEKQSPVFQLVYKSESHIIVNGIFPFPDGLILANDSGMTINPAIPATFSLKRIFKYPSWKYPGQYE